MLSLKLFLIYTTIHTLWVDQASTKGEDNIAEKLMRLKFKNLGTVLSSDQFVWKTQPGDYLEAENVTKVRYSWQVLGHLNYLYKKLENGTLVAPPVGMRSSVPLGGISTGFVELRADGSFHEWTIMNQTPGGAAKIQVFDDAFLAVSWKITNKASPGTRSDNLTFRPRKGRKAKIVFNDINDFWMKQKYRSGGYRLRGDRLRGQKLGGKLAEGILALRTHPSDNMKAANIQGVYGLEYSGAHPVTRLRVIDSRMPFNLTVFAFSAYSVNDMKFSAMPTVHFVPVVENPSSSDFDVSLHLVLPRGVEPRTQRSVKAMTYEDQKVYSFSKVRSDLDCFTLCNSNYSLLCKSWNWNSNGTCLLYNTINLNTFAEGMSSGLRSSWAVDSRGSVECLSHITPGDAPPSGNISLCANAASQMTTFNNLSHWSPSVTSRARLGAAIYGSLSTDKAEVHKGQTTALSSILMTWFYPTKDFLGRMYGNMYTQLFEDSLDASNKSYNSLNKALDDILVLNGVFFNSSLPDYLQDMLLNSISHVRSAMWFNDGRWRQWEAYDCTNLDSVHNDGERHIPYIMFLPESVKNKMLGWAKSQQSNGMIVEQLHEGCTFPDSGYLDTPSGRVMSDVTSMFMVYALELYKWGNEVDFTKQMWPFVKKAAQWHLDQSKTTGTLHHMVTTYDVLGMTAYDYSTYSTSFHMLAMRAAEDLAVIMGDTDFASECHQAYVRAQGVLDSVQWNSTGGYYNAYTQLNKTAKVQRYYSKRLHRFLEIDPTTSPPGAIMTDSFYSQVLAFSVGLGILPQDFTKLERHLQAEYRINNTPYGMLVLTGRYPYPGPRTDNAVWQMGNPNWATSNIHLGNDVDYALQVAEVTLDAWRSKVNDIWNVAGISGGIGYGAEGQPLITSHYGYFMSSWHLIMALTGQQANLPEKSLTFKPKVKVPYQFPVLLAGSVGVLKASATQFEVCILIGRPITLATLSVGGIRYPGAPPVLSAGVCVSWSH